MLLTPHIEGAFVKNRAVLINLVSLLVVVAALWLGGASPLFISC